MRFGLDELTIEKIGRIFARYERIEKAVVYGSRAKGNYKNGSDIDLTLMRSAETPADSKISDADARDICRILNDIDDLLLPYTVDLCWFEAIQNPLLREHIERVGCLFYAKSDGNATAAVCSTPLNSQITKP